MAERLQLPLGLGEATDNTIDLRPPVVGDDGDLHRRCGLRHRLSTQLPSLQVRTPSTLRISALLDVRHSNSIESPELLAAEVS